MRSVSDAFNWAFVNFPNEERGHWYVEIFPRMTAVAGFELGTGTFINTVDPAEAARTFRGRSGRCT
jgi:UDPglucose--hexose-1-phosphate uridylyltransferase